MACCCRIPQRSIDSEIPIEYQRLLTTQQIQRVYLNELDTTQQSVEIGFDTVNH
jgi:predicted transposase YdaD